MTREMEILMSVPVLVLASIGLLTTLGVVALLAHHQRRMAQLIREREESPRLRDALKSEVHHLRQVVQAHALAIREIKSKMSRRERYNQSMNEVGRG